MIIKLECVAIGETSGFGKSDTARALSTLPITIFDRHDLIRKVALIHVEVEAVHGDQLDEGDVIGLLILVLNVVAEHESAALARVRILSRVLFARSNFTWVILKTRGKK